MTATASLPQQPQHTFPPHEALPQPNAHQRPIAVPGAQRRDVKQTNGSIESSSRPVNSPAVNGTTGTTNTLLSSSKKKKKKKKSKRGSVAPVLEEDPTSEAEEPEEFYSDNDLPTATTKNALTAPNISQIYNPEAPYLQQNNQATQTDTLTNSISLTASPKKKKKKKKAKSSFVEVPIGMTLNPNAITNSNASQNPSTRRFGSGNTSLWTPSTPPEERLKIREFWFQLREDERRSLVKVEKEAVLKKMKEQQKHSCSCSVCGRKRTAIEEELEILYDAYYEELEVYAGTQVEGEGRIYPDFREDLGEMNDDEEDYDDEDEEEDYEDDEEGDFDEEEEYEDDEDGSEETDGSEEADIHGRHTHEHHGNSHTHDHATITRNGRRNGEFNFNFGNSLTVKEGGILTVADDLLKNDGKKFLEMMERLAERRMQKEEEAERDREEYEEDYEDGDEVYDEGEEENDMTDEQRMEEGRRMFQIFAARMFEQRVLTAYREKVARERQAKLLEELEEENRVKQERELKKLKEKEKKKDKKRQQKEQKEQERKEKEAAKQLEEDRLRAERDKKTEEEQRKREEDKLKREEERRLKEEERLRKEEEKREIERRRKGKEMEKEKKRKEEKEKKEREERERRERDEKQKKEREEKLRKEREEREKIKKEKEEKARKVEQLEKATTAAVAATTAIQSSTPSTSISIGVPLTQTAKSASSSEKRKSVPNTILTSTSPVTKPILSTSNLRTPTIHPMNLVLSPQQPPMPPPGVPAVRPSSIRSTSWGQLPQSPYPSLVNGSPQQLASSAAVNGTPPQAVLFGMPPPMGMGPIIGQPPYIRDQKSPVRALGIIGPPGVAPVTAISAAQVQAGAISSLGILSGNGSSVVTTSAGMAMSSPGIQAPQPTTNISTPIPPIGHTRRMSVQDSPITRVSTPPPLPSSSIKAISRPTPIAKPRRESTTSTIGAERRGSSVANNIDTNDSEAVKGVGSSVLDGEIVESLGRDVRGLSLSSVKESETVPVGVGSYFSGSFFAAPGRVDSFGPTSSFAPPGWGVPIPIPRPMGNDPGPWSSSGWGGLPGLAANNVFADVPPTQTLHEQIRERVKQVLAKLSTFSHPALPQAFPLAQVQHFFLEYFPDFQISEMDIYSACAQPGTGFTIYQDMRIGLLIRYDGIGVGGTGVIVGPGGVGGVGMVGGERGPGDNGSTW